MFQISLDELDKVENVLFRPSKSLVDSLQKKDYLKKAKVRKKHFYLYLFDLLQVFDAAAVKIIEWKF